MPRPLPFLVPAFAVASLMAAIFSSSTRADDPVDFARDIKPILHDRCVKCHAGTQKKGAFSINNRQAILAGGESGPAIVPKQSAKSELILRVTSTDANLRMPPEGKPLTSQEIAKLKTWIDQGAVWETGFAFAKEFRKAPLPLTQPAVPQLTKESNPLDWLLDRYAKKHDLPTTSAISDRVFLRRASLDLVGLLPTPEQLDDFEKSTASDKRAQLVEALLSNPRIYADHWLSFWNDALRNEYRGTGYIDGGRKQMTGWLYRALYENKPYDRFAHELVSPVAGSEGFTWGIVWRGVVNESQRREIQNAQNVSQVFLGTNLKCASCHDSFVNHWKLTDAYALASVFSDKPLEIHRCDKPTGDVSTVGFLFPELGAIDATASKSDRMKRLADLMIDPRNGRFPRTIVNRLWTKLMGRGIVEPLDDLDAEPWSQELLDYLAADLVEHRYDLKRTLTLIATSKAYQSPSVGQAAVADGEPFVFRGPFVKRMTAEQFVDGVRTMTGVWPVITSDLVTVDGRGQGGQLLAVASVLRTEVQPNPNDRAIEKKLADRFVEAKWIWSHGKALSAPGGEVTYARRTRKLDVLPAQAFALLTADNSVELFINGKKAASNENWESPVRVDVTKFLGQGENLFALKATNGATAPNPAGVIAAIAGFDAAGKLLWSELTDTSWTASDKAAEGWQEKAFDATGWKAAVAFASSKEGPWNIAAKAQSAAPSAAADVAAILGTTPIRASLTPLDALQSSLGRPNREQVVTIRESRATMLQALELANGPILDSLLQQGAGRWKTEAESRPDATIARLYRIALSREPNDGEKSLAKELAGTPVTEAGLADLLWTIVMSPEFQLIH